MRWAWICLCLAALCACTREEPAADPGSASVETVEAASPLPELSNHEPQVAKKLRAAYLAAENGAPSDWLHLGRVLFAHMEFEAAREAFVRAAEGRDDSRFEALYMAGVSAAYAGVPVSDALTHIESALTVRDDYAPARLRCADLSAEAGRMAVAERHYTRAMELAASSHALLGLARAALRRGDEEHARQLLVRARTMAPSHVEVSLALSRTLTRMGRTDEAVALAATIPPRHARTHIVDPIVLRACAETVSLVGLLQQAERAEAAGYPQDALRLLRSAMSFHPESARAHRDAGMFLARLGRHAAALTAYRDAARIAPQSGYTWSLRGRSELALGDIKQAEIAFRKGVAVQPDNAPARHALAEFLAEHGDADEALSIAAEIVADAPDHVESCRLLVRLLERDGQIELARRYARAAVRRAPGDEAARAQLARLER